MFFFKNSLSKFVFEDGDALEENSNNSKAFIEHLLSVKTAVLVWGKEL